MAVGGSLLESVDRTRTAPGARLLADWLSRPLAAVDAICDRHDAVDELLANDDTREAVRDELREVYDLERLLARVATGRCHARDLVQLATTLMACRTVGELVGHIDPGTLLHQQIARLDPAPELAEQIVTALVDEPPPPSPKAALSVMASTQNWMTCARFAAMPINGWPATKRARQSVPASPKSKSATTRSLATILRSPKPTAPRSHLNSCANRRW